MIGSGVIHKGHSPCELTRLVSLLQRNMENNPLATSPIGLVSEGIMLLLRS